MSSIKIRLEPIAGFCIKTTTLQSSVYTPIALSQKGENVLESPPEPIVLPTGFKIFVNIAWDTNVPPPPEGNEDAIQRAMEGRDVNEHNADFWYVPVIVSEGRSDKDKAGKPSLVFDCVYNSSLRRRMLTYYKFKLFLIELALQRIEAQTSLMLCREIGTPNISSKGKLTPRIVSIPSFLLSQRSSQTPLVQEMNQAAESSSLSTSKLKGILKTKSSPQTGKLSSRSSRLMWSWSKEGIALRVSINLPLVSNALMEQATVDVEPRRFIVQIPDLPVLDVNLYLPDAEIVATASGKAFPNPENDPNHPSNALTLKRERDFDVGNATSEWHVEKGALFINL